MQSSYKIIKGSYVNVNERQGKPINTYLENKKKLYENDPEIEEKPIDEEVLIKNIENQLRAENEKERKMIIEKAKKEALNVKKEIEDTAYEKAYEEGYEKGYEDGTTQGLNQGINESLNIKKRALDLVSQSEEYVKEYLAENKENIIELAATMAETIVHKTIDTSDKNIMMIIEPILREYGPKENIIITCHPESIPVLKDKLKELEEISGENKIIILKDGNLEKNGCTFENSKQFIDLQIQTQIENILEDIRSME